ncbi:MAG: hypothetical protein U0V02_09690 [Anaerolineales bacterium]
MSISALSYYLGFTSKADSLPNDESPDYADGGMSLPVFRGPYLQKDVSLAVLLYRADVNVLITLCDQVLNVVPSSPYRYVPLTSNVMLVYADMLVSSLDERDAQVGFIPETEVGFWVLTVAMQKTSNGEVPHHLAWFLPTLLVDESNSIATGREVYGFNKQAGEFNKPQEIYSPHFTADVLGFKQFAPDAIAQKERLLDVSISTDVQPQANWSDWSSVRDFFANEIMDSIRPDLGGSIIGFVAQGLVNHIPLVFLKQVRSALSEKKASYQRIIEAPLQIKDFYGGAKLTQSYTLSLTHLDSHPLAERLGLQSEQTNLLGAWLKVDFILGLGTEY